ncbi:MAG: hypothetical protein GXP49_10450 [Deltaproteobacteria bacterium]|nr:hypothetical protein [Deltaproteobacteria bacterium]
MMGRIKFVWFMTLLCIAVPAGAYILPSGFLLNSYYDQRPSSIKSFEIKLQTSLIGPSYEGGEASGREIWHIMLPMKFRSDIELPEGMKTVVVSRGRKYILEPGKEMHEEPAMFDPVINLLARSSVVGKKKTFRAGDLLLADLETAGVKTSVRGLTRFGEHIAIIIGAKEGEPTKPQLWIDKNSFLPLRYLSSNGKDSLDVRFSEYRTINRKKWLPGKIKIYRNGKLVEIEEVEEINLKWKGKTSFFEKPIKPVDSLDKSR